MNFLKPMVRVFALAALRAARDWVNQLGPVLAPLAISLLDYLEANLDSILDTILSQMGSLPPEEFAALPPIVAAALVPERTAEIAAVGAPHGASPHGKGNGHT